MLNDQEVNSKPARRYYEDLGRAHDYLMRCKDCQKLVDYEKITKRGVCKCGNKRFIEITTLTLWEWIQIKVGLIRFKDRKLFIKEFSKAAE